MFQLATKMMHKRDNNRLYFFFSLKNRTLELGLRISFGVPGYIDDLQQVNHIALFVRDKSRFGFWNTAISLHEGQEYLSNPFSQMFFWIVLEVSPNQLIHKIGSPIEQVKSDPCLILSENYSNQAEHDMRFLTLVSTFAIESSI